MNAVAATFTLVAIALLPALIPASPSPDENQSSIALLAMTSGADENGDHGQSSTETNPAKSGADENGVDAERGLMPKITRDYSDHDILVSLIARARAYADAVDALIETFPPTVITGEGDSSHRLESVKVTALDEIISDPDAGFGASSQSVSATSTGKGKNTAQEMDAKAHVTALIRDAALHYTRYALNPTERGWLRDSSLFRKRVHVEFAEALIHQLLTIIEDDLTPHVHAFAMLKSAEGVVQSAMAVEPRLCPTFDESSQVWTTAERVGQLQRMKSALRHYRWATLPHQNEPPLAEIASYELPPVKASLSILHDFVNHRSEFKAGLWRHESFRRNLAPLGEFLHKRVKFEPNNDGTITIANGYDETPSAESALHGVVEKYCHRGVVACPKLLNEEFSEWRAKGELFHYVLYVMLNAYQRLRRECISQMAELVAGQESAIAELKRAGNESDEEAEIAALLNDYVALGSLPLLVGTLRKYDAGVNGLLKRLRTINALLSDEEKTAIRRGDTSNSAIGVSLLEEVDATPTMVEPCTLIGVDIAATPPLPAKVVKTALTRLAEFGTLLVDEITQAVVKMGPEKIHLAVGEGATPVKEKNALRELVNSASEDYRRFVEALQPDAKLYFGIDYEPAQLGIHSTVAMLFELHSLFEHAFNTIAVGWLVKLNLLDEPGYRKAAAVGLLKWASDKRGSPVSAGELVFNATNSYSQLIDFAKNTGFKRSHHPSASYHLRELTRHLAVGHVVTIPSTPEMALERPYNEVALQSLMKLDSLLAKDLKEKPAKLVPLSQPMRLDLAWLSDALKRADQVTDALKTLVDLLQEKPSTIEGKLGASLKRQIAAEAKRDWTRQQWREAIAKFPSSEVKEAVYDAVKHYVGVVLREKEVDVKPTPTPEQMERVIKIHVMTTLFAFYRALKEQKCGRFLREVAPFVSDKLTQKLEYLNSKDGEFRKPASKVRVNQNWAAGKGTAERRPNVGPGSHEAFRQISQDGDFQKILADRLIIEC